MKKLNNKMKKKKFKPKPLVRYIYLYQKLIYFNARSLNLRFCNNFNCVRHTPLINNYRRT